MQFHIQLTALSPSLLFKNSALAVECMPASRDIDRQTVSTDFAAHVLPLRGTKRPTGRRSRLTNVLQIRSPLLLPVSCPRHDHRRRCPADPMSRSAISRRWVRILPLSIWCVLMFSVNRTNARGFATLKDSTCPLLFVNMSLTYLSQSVCGSSRLRISRRSRSQ